MFYCNSDEEIAADKLIRKLCQTFSISEKEKDAQEDRLQELFEQKGYHALFGKTQGYFGPYIWKDTVPTSYQIELPEGVEQYTVNILKGFVFLTLKIIGTLDALNRSVLRCPAASSVFSKGQIIHPAPKYKTF